MKIAYIEDDKDSRTIFSSRLKQLNWECESYDSAEAALPHIEPGKFDALIIDIRLPGLSGIELLAKLRNKSIHTPTILITAFNSLELAKEALNTNANYLLEKPFNFKTLKDVIEKIIHSPSSIQHCVDRGLSRLNLSEREEEVARLILKGLSNSEIARVLKLSEKTVKQYVTQIFEKAQVTSRSELFSYIFPI